MTGKPIPETIGKYRVLREIGRGATATVYLCDAPDIPVPVAVKLVDFGDMEKDGGKWNRRMKKLFNTEAGVCKRLDHPNIIRIHDAVWEDNRAYIVMDFVDGKPLDQFCTFETLMPVHKVVGIVFKCCMALDYAFKQGIVHRDIKPANILIGHDDTVKITDFGLALNISREVDQESTFIMGVGSPAYMSPEQIKNYPLNQKTDLYSLGVVLFHLLTGRLPFRARHPAQLVYRILNADTPSASQLNPDVPETMDAVIRKALEKDLYSRYRNGAEFAKDLAAVRYKLLDEDYRPPDTARFSVLRKMPFFLEFEDVEVWEVLRISRWLTAEPNALLIREGDTDSKFCLLIEGSAEASINGRRVATFGPGDVFGELMYLDPSARKRLASVASTSALTYLEIHPAALNLASEECLEHFRQSLVSTLVQRFATASTELAKSGEPVNLPKPSISALDLELVTDTRPRRHDQP